MKGSLRVIAVVPARGGYDEVPYLNIKKLGPLPLVAHTLRQATKSRFIDRTVVSTDDEQVIRTRLENSLEDRITFHPGDFLADELPSGFEMILECDVNVYGDALFRKVRASLRPGGRFVIIDLFAPEDGVAPPERVHWAFYGSLADPEHSYPTAAEVKGQLSDAGFTLLTERTLRRVGRERTRFGSGLSVIEARS